MIYLKAYFENIFMPNEEYKLRCLVNASLESIVQAHPHLHDEVEILYFKAGTARQQVNDKIFDVKEGDIVIINRNQFHSTYSNSGSFCEVLVLQFDFESFLSNPEKALETDLKSVFENDKAFQNPIDSKSNFGFQLLQSIFKIFEEQKSKDKSYQTMTKSHLLQLAANILRNDVVDTVPKGTYLVNMNVLKNTFTLIDEAYSRQITLKEASAASNMSIPHFCRIFKKTTGMTLIEYVNFHRLNLAISLLQSSKTQIEIAYECGFGSVSSFIRSFRKFHNCTPSEYKQFGDQHSAKY